MKVKYTLVLYEYRSAVAQCASVNVTNVGLIPTRGNGLCNILSRFGNKTKSAVERKKRHINLEIE